jgi:hypothetical protein
MRIMVVALGIVLGACGIKPGATGEPLTVQNPVRRCSSARDCYPCEVCVRVDEVGRDEKLPVGLCERTSSCE